MINEILGGAFGMQQGYFGQQQGYFGQQQAMYQQQLQNAFPIQYYPPLRCNHQTECLKCKEEQAERKEEQAERERIAAEKKIAYKNRCKEWMSKVGRKQP